MSHPTPSLSTPNHALLPVDLAGQWSDQAGLIFLDSALEHAGCFSLVAQGPVEILTGMLQEDTERLQDILHQHWRPSTEGRAPDGGLFGWVGYDGQYVLGLYPRTYAYDHTSRQWLGDAPTPAPTPTAYKSERGPSLYFQPEMDQESFCNRIARAQEYISAGDIYQANLSYAWRADWPAGLTPWDFYRRLRRASPSPYGAYMDLAGTQVCSASPECFLQMDGRHIVTRPIKGTRPRGLSPESDQQYAQELQQSPKERAELVMITDLERNDLGQVCEYGSVQVSSLLALELYAQVQHLVSTVEGTLRRDMDHVSAFAACFPGGSITGAPKKRAMEIIRELEPHDRQIYTGAIGGFGFNGRSHFNIAIRTAWRRDQQAHFHTGAGIVADSDPLKEWEETQYKAAGILHAARA